MLNVNCEACEDIRQNDPSLIVNGFTDAECASLKNDTGLNPSSGHNDCQDLTNMNDCLIGNEDAELENYEVCDWKAFMHNFIPNLWTLESGIICAICGIWTNIHNLWTQIQNILTQIQNLWTKVNCAYNSVVNLANNIANTTGGVAFVRRFRDLGTDDDVRFWDNVKAGFSGTLDIYMDSNGASGGSKPADRDYVVMISNCTNYVGFKRLEGVVTFFSSGDARPISVIRESQGQHPSVYMHNGDVTIFSWTTSGAVLLKKGEHIKVNFYASGVNKGSITLDQAARVRLHQFVLTWIPVNVEKGFDPSDVIKC